MVAPGLAVGIDVGGTKLAAGLVAADGTVIKRDRATTPAAEAEAIVALIVELAQRLSSAAGAEDVPVGVGAAGQIDLGGTVRYAPNIAWGGTPLRALLAAQLGVPVRVDNDANVAAWGEYRAGAAREAGASMVMLTLGTGVGGGLVIDDRLVRGAHGIGAEFGHIIVKEGGPQCPCGNLGCLEALASGTAIGRMASEARAAGRIPGSSALAEADELTGKTVTIAAHGGDPFANEVLAEAGFWLGVGIASLVNALDPELVVIGGGAMQAGHLLLEPARAAYLERLMGREQRKPAEIVRAQLADDAGIIGAALLALEDAPP